MTQKIRSREKLCKGRRGDSAKQFGRNEKRTKKWKDGEKQAKNLRDGIFNYLCLSPLWAQILFSEFW